MKRFIIVVLLAACVGLGWSGFVQAGTDLGQHCFQVLAGAESATLRISAVQADGSQFDGWNPWAMARYGRWQCVSAPWRGYVHPEPSTRFRLVHGADIDESVRGLQ